MSTTPRTDTAVRASGFQAVPHGFQDFARHLETELVKSYADIYHGWSRSEKAEAELAVAKAECERLRAMGSWAHTCIHHNDEERTRAERCPVCATAKLAAAIARADHVENLIRSLCKICSTPIGAASEDSK